MWLENAFLEVAHLLNPFNHPICFAIPERLVPSAWHEHIPFAMFLVDILRPEIIVELGTHHGGSYCTFCQAVKQLNLDSRCYAIDTWQGDAHSSFYGPEVLADLRAHHDLLYGGFSRLIQSTFEEALPHFADGTISLLHIDAYHSYEAVKRDFETWLPKMRRDGVILFHDTNVRERDFGVRKFWDEIKPEYRHFEFIHGHGLGVLAVGDVTSSEFQELLDATGEEAAIIRDFFFQLGNRLELKFENANKAGALSEKAHHISKQQEILNSLEVELEKHRQIVAERAQAVESLSALSAEKDQALQNLASERAEKDQALQKLTSQFAEKDQALQSLISQIAEKDQALQSLTSQAAEKDQTLQTLTSQAAEKDQTLQTLTSQAAEKDQTLQTMASAAAEKDGALHTLACQAAEHERVIGTLSVRLNEREEALQALSTQLEEKQQSVNVLRGQLSEKDQTIHTLTSQATREEQVITALSARLADQQETLRNLSAQVANKAETIRDLLSRAAEQEQAVANLSARLGEREQTVQALSGQVADKQSQLARITNTLGWRLLSVYGRRIKYPYLLPLYRLYGRIKYPYLLPVYRRLGLMPSAASEQIPNTQIGQVQAPTCLPYQGVITVKDDAPTPPLEAHRASADVIVCVHNALKDVERCLESVLSYTSAPYSLILVDDGSDEQTREYLASFVDLHHAMLIRNEQASGYTFAANQGLRQSQGDYVVLLNSDTVVTPDWLDRMIACGESDPRIGLVGPLSNAATWQSIPEIISNGEFAENKLPEGWTVADMGRLVAGYSARLYPRIPFLNGFCLMIKRQVIEQIGYFDEEVFGRGYGEENDYGLRALEAGWQLAVAEDSYVYHAQSRSYSHERRKELCTYAGKALAEKHGQQVIDEGVAVCRYDRVLEGMRARCQVTIMRRQFIEQGRALWKGKQVLFILPIPGVGGGGNVVLDEAEAMREMGVDVSILNLARHRAGFERDYPDNTLPVIYVKKETEIAKMLSKYDATVATWYISVDWLTPHESSNHLPVRAYYVQSFEPYLFYEGTPEYETAWKSYTRYPDLVRVTKTEWNRTVVKEKIGVECRVVGPSVNIDLYRPRKREGPDWPRRPLRIAAMIRANSPYRAPELTMEVLRELYRAHGDAIEIVLFGCDRDYPRSLPVSDDFSWTSAGVLTRPQTASLLNEIDVFVDFSTWQTMGLTAMEAMCCGAAVIVPLSGGASSFVKPEENGIIVDTSSREACLAALNRLVIDEKLRTRLQRQAIFDICQFFRERAAFNILHAMFQEPPCEDIARPRRSSEQMSKAQTAQAQPQASFPPRSIMPVDEVGPPLSEPRGVDDEGLDGSHYDRVLEGGSARCEVMAMRERFIDQGKALWNGKHLLFVLPISERSGGGNVVLDEAEAMRKMGVDVSVVNLARYRERFERHYHDNTLPVIYVNEETEISELLRNYDAVIATWYASVDWLIPPASSNHLPIRGYYIQDFEPHFFEEGSEEFKIAWDSYTRYPDLVRVTKTEWTRGVVKERIGVECTVVGPSVNIDLYQPRRRESPDWPHRPFRIAAMIRPSTSHRAPRLTLEILREFYRTHEETTELHFFGCDSYDLRTLGVPDDFPYRNAGVLTRSQIAALFNEIDIFADFSNYQAMGLTAMEAMCCGAAVIVPQRGGAASFVKHEENGIIVDTSSRGACLTALERLARDEELRTRLQRKAAYDICQFFPERAAFNILSAMFHESRRQEIAMEALQA